MENCSSWRRPGPPRQPFSMAQASAADASGSNQRSLRLRCRFSGEVAIARSARGQVAPGASVRQLPRSPLWQQVCPGRHSASLVHRRDSSVTHTPAAPSHRGPVPRRAELGAAGLPVAAAGRSSTDIRPACRVVRRRQLEMIEATHQQQHQSRREGTTFHPHVATPPDDPRHTLGVPDDVPPRRTFSERAIPRVSWRERWSSMDFCSRSTAETQAAAPDEKGKPLDSLCLCKWSPCPFRSMPRASG